MVFKWFDFLLLVFPVTKNSHQLKIAQMCEKNVQCTLNIGIDKFLCCENSLMIVFATGKKQKVGGLIRRGKKWE